MLEKEKRNKDSKKVQKEKNISVIYYNQILETININTPTDASQKVKIKF